MPDTTPPNVAAPAAATPTPSAPPTPTPPAPQGDGKEPRHPNTHKLMQALFGVAEDKKETPPAAKPEPKPEPEKKVDPVKPEAKEPPIGVRKKNIKRPDIPVAQPKTPVAQAPTPVTPPKQEIELAEDDLVPEEKEYLKDLADLEAMDPKYKGLSAKGKKFLADRIKFLESNPDMEEGDPAFQNWLKKNKPSISQKELTSLEVHRQTSKVKQEYDGKLTDLQHENYVREEAPKIKKEANDLYVKISRAAMPDEILAKFDESMKAGKNHIEAMKQVKDEFSMEVEIAENIMTEATSDLEEFMRITRVNPTTGKPVKQFDPNNPLHLRLHDMIGEVCEQFKKTADPKQQVRDGKWFVTRDEWNNMAPESRSQFWTFKNAEIVNEATRSIKGAIKGAIDQKRQELARYGFVRQPRAAAPAAPAAQPPPTPTTHGSPPAAPRPSPIPNNAPPAAGVDPKVAAFARHLTGG